MKKTFILALSLLPLSVFSQAPSVASAAIDARLYEAFDKAYVDKVAQEDPFLLKRWTFYLDHAYYVTDALVSKDGIAMDYPSVNVPDLAHINILKLETEQKLIRDYYVESIFKIKGTNKFLVYHSGRNFVESLNEHLQKVQETK